MDTQKNDGSGDQHCHVRILSRATAHQCPSDDRSFKACPLIHAQISSDQIARTGGRYEHPHRQSSIEHVRVLDRSKTLSAPTADEYEPKTVFLPILLLHSL